MQQNHIRLGEGSIALGGGAAATALAALLALLVLWAAAYLGGLAPWLGFEQRTVRNLALGR